MDLVLQLVLVLCLCILYQKVDARNHNQQKRFQRSSGSRELESVLLTRDSEFDCIDIYKQPAFQNPLLKNHKIQLATLDTNQNTTYHGGYAKMNICNVTGVHPFQYSLSQIYAQSGPPAQLDVIQAGFGVAPEIYGDNRLRIIAYWKGKGKPGCFNILCPGFIQVDRVHGFGSTVNPVSQIGGNSQYYMEIHVEQDKKSGNWWLILDNFVKFGYWPKELFGHLNNGASMIRFGGEAAAPLDKPSPPMGTGKLPQAGYKNACTFYGLRIMDSGFTIQDINPRDMKIYLDTSPNFYDLRYQGYMGRHFREAFLYGGPGGQYGV
ncbi:hypothetical protein VNO77_21211 [Canavalia gladiata]|uniref:Neprosin PEP catalytic domain-containing protein n=1 Tax=Canavalia gladiata TaxID=3824 RepID=A0AAN9QK27_CANGL